MQINTKNACHITYCRKIASLHNYILFTFSIFSWCLLFLVTLGFSLGYTFSLWKHSDYFVLIKKTCYRFLIKILILFCKVSMKGMFAIQSMIFQGKIYLNSGTENELNFFSRQSLMRKPRIFPYVCGELWFCLKGKEIHIMRILWGRILYDICLESFCP